MFNDSDEIRVLSGVVTPCYVVIFGRIKLKNALICGSISNENSVIRGQFRQYQVKNCVIAVFRQTTIYSLIATEPGKSRSGPVKSHTLGL